MRVFSLTKALLALLISIPFIASGTILVLLIRALARGQLVTKGRYLPARIIYRDVQPVQYWLEIALYVVCGAFLLLMGLMWTGHDPPWFHEMMLHRFKTSH